MTVPTDLSDGAATPDLTAATADLAEQLAREYSASLYRQAFSMVRDHALAEDIVQETLIKAWQGYAGYRGEAPLGAWVMRIGHNTAVSALRRLRDQPTDPESMPEVPTGDIAAGVADRIAVEELWRALDEVDPTSREILVLREVEGRSYEDISAITGVSLGTVKTRLFRTRRLLADRLGDWR